MKYPQPMEAPVAHSHLPARILLLAGVVLSIASILFIHIPGMDCLYVHYWVYIVLQGLPLICFVGALGMAIYQRITLPPGLAHYAGDRGGHTGLRRDLPVHAVYDHERPRGASGGLLYLAGGHASPRGHAVQARRRKLHLHRLSDEGQALLPGHRRPGAADGQRRRPRDLQTSEDVAQVTMLDNDQNEVTFTVDFNDPHRQYPEE